MSLSNLAAGRNRGKSSPHVLDYIATRQKIEVGEIFRLTGTLDWLNEKDRTIAFYEEAGSGRASLHDCSVLRDPIQRGGFGNTLSDDALHNRSQILFI